MKLPDRFLEKIKNHLGEEYQSFIESFKDEHNKAIRVNLLKISVDEYKKISPFHLEEIPWIKEGFYIHEDELRPGKHPHYHCGLYYIQEPSAMIPVQVLDPQPGERILDISAAPGGKATQIGAKLGNQGVLVANDISPKRVRALAKNIQIFGIKNCIVTNDTPKNLASRFEYYFDKILVDAPCSGEGMFRRDPKMLKTWEESSVDKYSEMQRDILNWVPKMLKPGGKLVYSTCTFSPEENEGTIEWFLEKYPEFEVEDIKNITELDRGRPEWIGARGNIEKTRRLWPHKTKGEGHYVALLRKKDGDQSRLASFKGSYDNIDGYLEFVKNNLTIEVMDNIHLKGSYLYSVPLGTPDISGIRVIAPGLFLGENIKNRFQPNQALAMALTKEDGKNIVNFSSDSLEGIKYLKGETLNVDGEKGWRLVCIDGFPVGWGKQVEGYLKNYLYPDWRIK